MRLDESLELEGREEEVVEASSDLWCVLMRTCCSAVSSSVVVAVVVRVGQHSNAAAAIGNVGLEL